MGNVVSHVHVIAIVKGAVELDTLGHFASLNGIVEHLVAAADLGLIGAGDDSHYDDERFIVPVTDRGRQFYIDADLASLPAGRANHWGHAADRAIALLKELESQ